MSRCRYKLLSYIVLVGTMVLLGACTVTPPRQYNTGDSIEKALHTDIYRNQHLSVKNHASLPASINQALMPDLTVQLPNSKTSDMLEHRFNISVDNVPAQAFFMGLVKDTNYNMVVSPKVSGSISLHLKQVTIPEVMDAVRDIYGFEYQRTAYGFQVLPRELETRIFSVNYLDMSREGVSDTTISSGQITQTIQGAQSSSTSSGTSSSTTATKPSSDVKTTSKTDLWAELQENLKAMIGEADGHSVVINKEAGIITVRAYPDELREVAQYLDHIQNVMQREVIIEAKILEVELNANYKAGIDWSVLGLQQIGNSNFNDNLQLAADKFTQIFTLDMHGAGAFSTIVNLLNSQGRVNVLSSPHISTINNQKAVMKVGQDEFFVTNVSSTSSTSGGTTAEDIAQDVELTPFFSGIALDVTPQINKNGMITLHVHPIVSKVTEDTKTFTVSDKTQTLPLAKSTIRESDSIVRAKNGQIVVIGGLMEDGSSDYQANTPVVDQLPTIGGLFKSKDQTADKFELVILLRPVVVGPNTWTDKLKSEVRRIQSLPKTFRYTSKVHLRRNKTMQYEK